MSMNALKLSAVAGLAMLASSAVAQTTFRLVRLVDVGVLSTTGNAFRIGDAPGDAFITGDDLYVGGVFNGGADGDEVRIVLIGNVFELGGNPRTFTNIPDSIKSVGNAPGRGWNGLDYAAGTQFGLAASIDSPTDGIQIVHWDIDTQINPIYLGGVNPSPRGIAQLAWDFGPDGNGFALDDGLGGTVQGPAIGVLDFTADASGPFGFNPITKDAFAPVYAPGFNGGPLMNVAGISGTIWRSLDVHPRTGTMVGRAANDAVIVPRDANGEIPGASILIDNGDAPFVVGQNIEIVHGLCNGDTEDLVLYNLRPNGAITPFANVFRATDMSGSPVTVNFVDLNGDPVDFDRDNDGDPTTGPGNGYLSFNWNETDRRLTITDFGNRFVYVLQAPFNPDLTGSAIPGDPAFGVPDGQVTTDDFFYYLTLFASNDPAADITGSAVQGAPGFGVPDFQVTTDDFFFFLTAFAANDCI